jgi:hypothetical protein
LVESVTGQNGLSEAMASRNRASVGQVATQELCSRRRDMLEGDAPTAVVVPVHQKFHARCGDALFKCFDQRVGCGQRGRLDSTHRDVSCRVGAGGGDDGIES